MLKNLTGGAIINYGATFPASSTAFDGMLFYKTSGSDQGLYVFGFAQDSDTLTFGDQSIQAWTLVQSPGLYVDVAGDTMTGDLRLANDGLTLFSNNFTGAVTNMPMSFTNNDAFTWNRTDSQMMRLSSTSGTPSLEVYFGNQWRTVFHEGNIGAGSGLDADKLDGEDSAFYRSATNINAGTLNAARLPFMPVQQGGGGSQLGNKIYIGWSGVSTPAKPTDKQLLLQVDATNYLNVWPISIEGNSATANFATSATNATNATNATSARYVRANADAEATNMTFSNTAGTNAPARIWGTNDTTNFATWNPYDPTKLNVAKAAEATQVRNAATAGGLMSFNWSATAETGTPTDVWGTTDGATWKAYSPANFAVASAGKSNETLQIRSGATAAGTLMTFTYSDVAGTPARVWGSANGTTWNAYTPSTWRVADAATADSADAALKVRSGGTAAGTLLTFANTSTDGNAARLMGSNSTGTSWTSYSPANITVGAAGVATTLVANASLPTAPIVLSGVTKDGYVNIPRIRVGTGNAGNPGWPSITFQESVDDTGFYSGGDGIICFASGGQKVGDITGSDLTMLGNITAYSDIRLKKNIENIPDALNKVHQLRGVTFDRTDVERRQTGVIAQEVQEVLPEAVIENGEGILSVAYGNMVGLLIESIKELSGTVDQLKKELAELKAGK